MRNKKTTAPIPGNKSSTGKRQTSVTPTCDKSSGRKNHEAQDYFGPQSNLLSIAYAGFLSETGNLDCDREVALIRSHIRVIANFIDEILGIGGQLLPDEENPENRLEAILQHYTRIQRPLFLLNASLTTFDRLVRTLSTLDRGKSNISPKRFEETIDVVIKTYDGAVREILNNADLATKIKTRFLQALTTGNKDLEEFLGNSLSEEDDGKATTGNNNPNV